jgi:hypothetical protein
MKKVLILGLPCAIAAVIILVGCGVVDEMTNEVSSSNEDNTTVDANLELEDFDEIFNESLDVLSLDFDAQLEDLDSILDDLD